jgi:hypothetical protein
VQILDEAGEFVGRVDVWIAPLSSPFGVIAASPGVSEPPTRCTFDPQKRVLAWASGKRLPNPVFGPSFPPLPIVSDARRTMMQPATTEVSLKKRSGLFRLDEPAGASH